MEGIVYPALTIVMTTYFPEGEMGRLRKLAAVKTLYSWRKHLRYVGDIRLHVADDGSEHASSDLPSLWCPCGSYSQQQRKGVGASMNTGIKRGFERSPLVAMFMDDWSLTETFDITPWARLLLERNDVGMVRLGPPHPGTSGVVEAFTEEWQGWGLRLDRSGFAFGHRPAIYHRRLFDSYGYFAENTNALECERLYNETFRGTQGPDVVLALPHPWFHINTTSMSGVEPK